MSQACTAGTGALPGASPWSDWQSRAKAAVVRAVVAGRQDQVTESADAALAGMMVAAQAGDSRAYQALLRACLPIASATARRQGVPPDRLDDVVQEVLLTIHRARATYDPSRPFTPWLRAIAQRRAIDSLRSHGRRAGREVFDEFAYLNHPDGGPQANDGLHRDDESRTLAAAIAKLPPGQRQAVDLLALRDHSLDEASAATGRTKGALKVNLHRAIQALRTQLRGEDDV
jgi:RNA polymerase sigma-70 factor (ECF subfamily)